MARIEVIEEESQKLVKVTLEGDSIRAEAGALHYYQGDVQMSSQVPSAGGMLRSMMTGETVFRPTYSGRGVVFLGPPTFGEYVVLELKDEHWVLDQGAYVCSEAGIEVGAVRNKAWAALRGGDGWFQTSVKGTGKVVFRAPGTVREVAVQGERLAVNGTFAVARTASLDFDVARATGSIVGSVTSGEGLLNTYTGSGKVLLASVPNRHLAVVEQCRRPMIAAPARRAPNPLGGLIALFVVGFTMFLSLILMAVLSVVH